MSVDKLRETHHINRVAPSDLGLLMSAQSYRPEITQAIRKIKSFPWAPLQSLVKNVISPGPHPAYGGTYPCLKTKNVNELLADLEPADFADVIGISNLEKVQVERGDLLINLTGAGSIGRVSIYYGDDLPITNQHIARMGIKDAYDEGYVAAFLRSWWGERALEQGVAGSTGQINMVNDHVRSIPVIIFNSAVQKYIGDKVRQAERLRAWAKAERVKIDLYFDSILNGIYQERPERCFSRISNEILVPRLNAEFYAPEFVSVEIGLRQKFGKLTTIGKLAPTIRSKEKPRGDCRYFEIGDLSISKGTFEQGSYYKKGEAPNNAQRKFDIGDVAVSTRRPNRGAIAVVEDGDVNNFYSVFLARLKPKNISFGYWLKEFLRHEIGKLLLQQRCTWTTYPVISEDDLETIPVPVIEGDWEYISNLSKQSVLLEYHSKQLSNSAKLLVEDLIEGQITEAQLIAAEQALQAGNDALDRKILGRLKTDGIDGDGAALFSDLDELYRLLALAEVE